MDPLAQGFVLRRFEKARESWRRSEKPSEAAVVPMGGHTAATTKAGEATPPKAEASGAGQSGSPPVVSPQMLEAVWAMLPVGALSPEAKQSAADSVQEQETKRRKEM